MATKPKRLVENPNSAVYINFLAGKGCQKLYLDTRTSDVVFLFQTKTDETDGNADFEEIPAHKSILSAMSPAFDAMFYGPAKEPGDIKIVHSTSEAFKEFLQFFYLTKVELTTENLLEVMNLGKQYLLDDCLIACTDFCKATLTLDNMCWGYELAILFDLDELKRFCEQKISTNTIEIFRSSSFLNCEPNLLWHILQLDTLECNESVVFDGCIAWAKVACVRNGLTAKRVDELRSQLGDLFYEIRFGELTHKHFHDRYRLYDGLFSLEEFRDITMMITSKHSAYQTKFNQNPRTNHRHCQNDDVLVCDRKAFNPILYKVAQCPNSNGCVDKTIFQSNLPQQLKRICCSVKFHGINAEAKIKVREYHDDNHQGNLLFFANILLPSAEETIIEFPSPIAIKPDVKYDITFELENGYNYSSELVRNNVHMDKGIMIEFSGEQHGMQSMVKALHFNK